MRKLAIVGVAAAIGLVAFAPAPAHAGCVGDATALVCVDEDHDYGYTLLSAKVASYYVVHADEYDYQTLRGWTISAVAVSAGQFEYTDYDDQHYDVTAVCAVGCVTQESNEDGCQVGYTVSDDEPLVDTDCRGVIIPKLDFPHV